MTDKSGGDIIQGNAAGQANLSAQELNSVGAAGAGVLDSMGGSAAAMGAADQAVQQAQMQSSQARTGSGGDDNINANTTINIS